MKYLVDSMVAGSKEKARSELSVGLHLSFQSKGMILTRSSQWRRPSYEHQ